MFSSEFPSILGITEGEIETNSEFSPVTVTLTSTKAEGYLFLIGSLNSLLTPNTNSN